MVVSSAFLGCCARLYSTLLYRDWGLGSGLGLGTGTGTGTGTGRCSVNPRAGGRAGKREERRVE